MLFLGTDDANDAYLQGLVMASPAPKNAFLGVGRML
jgi:hypothetical protein